MPGLQLGQSCKHASFTLLGLVLVGPGQVVGQLLFGDLVPHASNLGFTGLQGCLFKQSEFAAHDAQQRKIAVGPYTNYVRTLAEGQ